MTVLLIAELYPNASVVSNVMLENGVIVLVSVWTSSSPGSQAIWALNALDGQRIWSTAPVRDHSIHSIVCTLTLTMCGCLTMCGMQGALGTPLTWLSLSLTSAGVLYSSYQPYLTWFPFRTTANGVGLVDIRSGTLVRGSCLFACLRFFRVTETDWSRIAVFLKATSL